MTSYKSTSGAHELSSAKKTQETSAVGLKNFIGDDFFTNSVLFNYIRNFSRQEKSKIR